LRTLIAGCGYVGSALGERLAADGHEVWGLCRKFSQPAQGVRPIEADLGLPSDLLRLPGALDFVVYLVSAQGADDALYRTAYVGNLANLLAALEAAGERPRRVVFASSTAVYAQGGGEWVDEESPTEPTHFSGRRLLEGEACLAGSPFPTTAVRFGGIYGPRRTGLVERVRTGAARCRPGHYTNRIHRDDCVGTIAHLLALESPEELYLAVDSEPATDDTVQSWLAGALGTPVPRRAAAGDAPARRGNKRCRNARLRASGYRFRHPTFREGYRSLLGGDA
jgi:nucleoside-diphosphate-sugar epimerase